MTPTPATIIQTAEIPSIPNVLQQILSLADNPSTTGTQLEQIVSQEPALVSQLLKWVNSAYYSLPRRVSSISHAMILLGFSTVKSIASGLMLINAFADMPQADKDFVNRVWTHTLMAANYSKILTAREAMGKQDDIFLAAMIHDVGYIVLRAYFGKKYKDLSDISPFPSPTKETEVFGVDHVQIGTELLKQWRFPEEVIELVRCHHHVSHYTGSKKDVTYIILSDLLSYEDRLGDFLNENETDMDMGFLQLLAVIGWDWKRLQAVRSKFLEAEDMIKTLFTQM